LFNAGLIGLSSAIASEDPLADDPGSEGIEVGLLDAGGLIEQGSLLEVRRVRDQLHSFAVFIGEIFGDGATLKEDEAVVVEVRNLSERLTLKVLWGPVLPCGEIDGYKLDFDAEFMGNGEHSSGAGRRGGSVKFEYHGLNLAEEIGIGADGVGLIRSRPASLYIEILVA